MYSLTKIANKYLLNFFMNRAELEHAIRAACDLTSDTEVIVFGSQAILGQYPNAPEALRQSAEADVVPKNRPDLVDLVDAVLGEGSQFHRTHGFYVHGVPLETALLPTGWEDRTFPVSNENTRGNTGWCVEGHDLAASKLAAFRDKDREFVRVLLREGLIGAELLHERVMNLPIEGERKSVLDNWITGTRRRA